MKQNLGIYGALLAVVFFWSSAFVGIRYALTDFHPGALALLRFAVASLCMLCLYVSLKTRRRPSLKELLAMLSLGVVGIGIYNLALNFGEQTVNAAIASFIISLIPVVTTVLAIYLLKEPFNWQIIVGSLISLSGLVLMGGSELLQAKLGMGFLLVCLATFSGALYTTLQRLLLSTFHPIEVTAFVMWGGTLCFLVFTPELISDLKTAHLATTLTTIYLGVFPAAIAYAAWSFLLSKMKASDAALYLYLLPLVSTLLAFLFLHEVPNTISLVGGLIALCGALYTHSRVKGLGAV
jgi:drug/metabolite transporter (DMT)-like permease